VAYEEPGVKVILEVAEAGVVIQTPEQELSLVGELYEVFEEEPAAERYDPSTGAGDQSFVWPSKKTTSVVDLSGIRADNAEPDDQLLEAADFPIEIKLRDPSTLQESVVNLVDNVENVTQTGFKIDEGATAATARDSGSDVSAAELGKFYKSAGGLINAGLTIGDRIRLTNGTFDVLGEVTAFTDNEVTYDTGAAAVADDPNFDGLPSGATQVDTPPAAGVSIDGDIQTTPGNLVSGVGGFTAGGAPDVQVGDRIAIWRELSQFNDGNGTTANTVTSAGGHGLVPDVVAGDSVDVGRRVSLQSANVADGALSAANAETTGTTNLAAAGLFSSTDVGKLVRISGGTNTLPNTYRRIVAFVDGSNVTVDSAIAATGAADADLIVFIPMVREIDAIPTANSFTYVDGTSAVSGDIADGSQVDISVVVHDKVLRDVTAVVDDNTLTYSGTAVTSVTGFGLNMPFDLFEEDLTFEIYPDYEVLTTFRALDITGIDDTLTLSTPTEVANLGDNSPNNPLLFAAKSALAAMGTTDGRIQLMPIDLWPDDLVGSKSGLPEDKNELLGYQGGLEVLAAEETAYYLVPLTRQPAVRDAFETHVDANSVPEQKQERIAYLTYDLPLGEFESTTGIIEPGADGGNKVIRDPGQGFVTIHGILPGKVVTILTPSGFAADYVAAIGTTDDELHLEGADWTITPEFAVTDADAVSAPGELITNTAEAWKDVDVGDYIQAGGVYRQVTVKTSSVRLSYGGGAIPQAVESTAADGVGTGTTNLNSVTIGFVSPTDIGKVVEFSGGTGAVPSTFGRIVAVPGVDDVTLDVTVPTSTGMTVNVYAALPAAIVRSSSGVNYYVDPLSKDEQADALKAISEARANFRIVHMWPDQVRFVTGTDQLGNDVEEDLPSFYAAAAEAGRDSVLNPERSSTGEALAGPVGLLHSNKFFGKTRLNTIASGGWAILEQAATLGPVEMRHLLSTDMSSVKRQEVSVTKNVDNMAKVTRASLAPNLNDNKGRVNITQPFLNALLLPLQGIMSSFAGAEQLVVGPDGEAPFTILGLGVDPVAIDQINARVDLTVPIPGNRVEVTFVI
jgi:hypothetical protein